MPGVRETVEAVDKVVDAAEKVSRWTPRHGLMFAFVLMLTGGVTSFGWSQWSMEQAAGRARADALERESQLIRFMQGEFDKNREEREKDRREREQQAVKAEQRDAKSTAALGRLEASTDALTKALKAKTGNIMD